MNLFEDDNKNEAAPAREPVSAKPAEKPKPTVTPAAKASKSRLISVTMHGLVVSLSSLSCF
nr:hypothetical protein [Klebsiella variicola]